MNALNQAGLLLVHVIFGIYIFIVILHILLEWADADYYSPLSTSINKLIKFPLEPLRRIIPRFHGIDIAAVVFLLVLQIIKLTLIAWLQTIALPHFSGLIIWAFADLFHQIIDIFFFAILIIVFASWFFPMSRNPLLLILYRLTEPLLTLARRVIPPMASIDFSPVVILLALKLLEILLVNPLLQIGIALSLRGIK